MFSDIPLPKMDPAGFMVGAMHSDNALTKENLDNQMSRINNEIKAPYAAMAQPFAQAALQQAQATPQLTMAQVKNALANAAFTSGPQTQQAMAQTNYINGPQSQQALANAGLLGQDAKIKAFQLANPAYINPEAYQWSQPIPGMGGSVGNSSVNTNSGNPISSGGLNGAIGSQQPSQNPLSNPGQNQFNPQNYGDLRRQMLMNQFNAQNAKSQTDIKNNNAYPYLHATPDAKNFMIAKLAGAGISPDESIAELSNGKNVNQILQDRGFNPDDIQPHYIATSKDVEEMHKKQAALSALSSLSSHITSATSPYSSTMYGYSPQQVADSIRDSDPDKQAQFLAARQLQTELAAVRGKMVGLNMGKTVLNSMIDKNMGDVKVFKPYVSSEVYTKMQNYIDKWLSESVNSANDAVSNIGSAKSSSDENDPLGLRKK